MWHTGTLGLQSSFKAAAVDPIQPTQLTGCPSPVRDTNNSLCHAPGQAVHYMHA